MYGCKTIVSEIDEQESNGFCIFCGVPTIDDDFCSIVCMQTYAKALPQIYRQPMSNVDMMRMGKDLFPIQSQSEGMELDITIEHRKETESKKEWAIRQARLLWINLYRY